MASVLIAVVLQVIFLPHLNPQDSTGVLFAVMSELIVAGRILFARICREGDRWWWTMALLAQLILPLAYAVYGRAG
jgi:hypothetical protein